MNVKHDNQQKMDSKTEDFQVMQTFRKDISQFDKEELLTLCGGLQDEIFALSQKSAEFQKQMDKDVGRLRYKIHIVHNKIGCCGEETEYDSSEED